MRKIEIEVSERDYEYIDLCAEKTDSTVKDFCTNAIFQSIYDIEDRLLREKGLDKNTDDELLMSLEECKARLDI